jgi:hypothetical protein
MDFEYNGSTSNVSRIPATGKNYFRFIAKRVSATSPVFWKAVDSNLIHNIPVIFSISASNGAGHSIVCDGFKIENNQEYHHLNMGWWGSSNGWYKIKDNFNVGGYNKIDHGLINFLPVPMIFDPEVLDDSTRLLISWLVSEKIFPNAFEIQIKMDDSNWKSISDTLNTTSFSLKLDENIKEYSFRIRSKIDGKWYDDSWSNIVTYRQKSTATYDIYDRNITIWPNPFKENLNIDVKNQFSVDIYSINGDLIYQNSSKNKISIPSNHWKDGIYIVKIIREKQVKYLKIVK